MRVSCSAIKSLENFTFPRSKMMFIGVLLSLLLLHCVAQTPNKCADKNFHTLETDATKRAACGPAFLGRCFCHMTCYEGLYQHIVNCTDAGFTDTKPLEHIPNNTRALIFTGNNLPELSWNILGTQDTLPELHVIDMSNNKIQEIRGKTFHHVKSVHRLILDFNELSLNPSKSHPRVLSNFESLTELHLTDAFEDGAPKELAATLHEIFVKSNLTQLTKLHLEQNEISEFRDPNVFCDLPELRHLYLGSNFLNALHFNLTCLPKLTFLDLEHNNFTKVSDNDLITLDSIVKENEGVTVDFTQNPFQCGCKLNPFVRWMHKTKIIVRNPNLLKCAKGKEYHVLKEEESCSLKLKKSSQSASYQGTTVALWILSLLLVVLILALIYVQRVELRKRLEPVIDSVSKRVRYTSIATGEIQKEIDV